MDETTKLKGYDDCIIGYCERKRQDRIVAYDKDKIVRKIMAEKNLTINNAMRVFEDSILSIWDGMGTPCFITMKKEWE